MILGLVGLAGSGKSTAAVYLVEKYGFKQINFKDALVAEVKDRFPDLLRVIATENGKEKHRTELIDVDSLFTNKPYLPAVRALLQNHGTEVRRRDNPRYWFDKWMKKAQSNNALGNNIVCDDCRFLNEADAIHLVGGQILRISRTDITEAMNHASETEQLKIEHDMELVCGPGEHDKLYNMLDLWIEEHGKT